jgi:hypothetical protein
MQNYVQNKHFSIIFRLTKNKKNVFYANWSHATLPIGRGRKNEEDEIHF